MGKFWRWLKSLFGFGDDTPKPAKPDKGKTPPAPPFGGVGLP